MGADIMSKKWFEKYIGCAFSFNNQEVIFIGTCLNSEIKNGLPLQYIFEPNNIIVDYKTARSIMGAMIDKNTYNMIID